MKQCKYCGAQTENNSLFCPKCGKPIPQDNACPHCGAIINDGDVFCTNCGAPVQVNETDDNNGCLDESKVKVQKKKQTKRKQTSSGTQPKKRRATPKNQSFYDTSEENNEELSLTKKIGLGIPIICTAMGAFIGFEEGHTLFAIVSAILFFIPIYVFNTPTAYRYTWWTVVFVLIGFVFSFALINEHDNTLGGFHNSEDNIEEIPERSNKEPSNLISNFVGKYTLYDEHGDNLYPFVVVDDGRLVKKTSLEMDNYKIVGRIKPVSNTVFTLDFKNILYIDAFTYKNGYECTNYGSFYPGKTFVFDVSEKRIYIDKDDYDNRDVTTPEYYKFRFSK